MMSPTFSKCSEAPPVTPVLESDQRAAKRARVLSWGEVEATSFAPMDNSWISLYAAHLKKWLISLGNHHPNCLEIPAQGVVALSIAILRSYTTKNAAVALPSVLQTPAVAAFWIALKFLAPRHSLPSASFIGAVTCVDKAELLPSEMVILETIEWDVCTVAKGCRVAGFY